MAVKIQIKRGSKAGLPKLAPGEQGLATDTQELFIGGANGNLQVPVLDGDGNIPEKHLPPMNYDPAGTANTAVQQHNTSKSAHQDIRKSMVTAAVQVTYNGGGN